MVNLPDTIETAIYLLKYQQEGADGVIQTHGRVEASEEKLTKATRARLDAVERMIAGMDRQSRATQQLFTRLEQLERLEQEGISTATRRAAATDLVFKSFNQQNEAVGKAGARLAELTAKFDPASTSARKMATEIADLNEAQRLGITIAGGYEAALAKITAQYNVAGNAAHAFAASQVAAQQQINAAVGVTPGDVGQVDQSKWFTRRTPTATAAGPPPVRGPVTPGGGAAEQSASVFTEAFAAEDLATAEAAVKEQERLAAAALKVRDAVNPLLPLTRSYRDALKELNDLVGAGLLEQKDYEAALQQTKVAFAGQVKEINGLAQAERDAAAAAKEAAAAAQQRAAAAQSVTDKINPLAKAQREYIAELRQLNALRPELGERTYAAALDQTKRNFTGLVNEIKGVTQAEEIQDKITKQLAADTQALRDKINPLGVAQRVYAAEVTKANELLAIGQARGGIDATEHAQALTLAKTKLDDFGKSARGGASEADLLAQANRRMGATVTNLTFQLNDVVTGLISGQQPMRILAQQGGQILQAFQTAPGGAGGVLAAFAGYLKSLITPTTAAIAGVAALAGGFAYLVSRSSANSETLRQFNLILQSTGHAALTTATQVQQAARQLQLLGVSRDDATRAQQAILRNPALNVAAADRIGVIGANVGQALGIGATAGIETFTKAASDGVEALISLGIQTQKLTDNDARAARELAAGGNELKARNQLIGTLEERLSGLAKNGMSPMQDATATLETAWDDLLKKLGETGPVAKARDALIDFMKGVGKAVSDQAAPGGSGSGSGSGSSSGSGSGSGSGTSATSTVLAGAASGAVTGAILGWFIPEVGIPLGAVAGGLTAAASLAPERPKWGPVVTTAEIPPPLPSTGLSAGRTSSPTPTTGLTVSPDLKGDAGIVVRDPKVIDEVNKALQTQKRELEENLKVERDWGVIQQANQAALAERRRLIALGATATEAATAADRARNDVLQRTGIELEKLQKIQAERIQGDLRVAQASRGGQAAAIAATAAEQARVEVLERYGTVAGHAAELDTRRRLIVEAGAAGSIKSTGEQIVANNNLIAAQERLANATALGTAEGRRQETENTALAATEKVVSEALATHNEALIKVAKAQREVVKEQEAAKESAAQSTAAAADTNALRRQGQQVGLQQSLVGRDSDEIQRQASLLAGAQKLADQYADATEKVKDNFAAATADLVNQNFKLAKLREEQERTQAVFKGIASSIESTLGTAIDDVFAGKKIDDWGARLKSMWGSIQSTIAKETLLKPLIGTGLKLFGASDETVKGYGTFKGLFDEPKDATGAMVTKLAQELPAALKNIPQINVSNMKVEAAEIGLKGAIADATASGAMGAPGATGTTGATGVSRETSALTGPATATGGSRVTATGAIVQGNALTIQDALGYASQKLPEGYRIVITEGHATSGHVSGSAHYQDNAIDYRIMDASGSKIPNTGPDTTGLYRGTFDAVKQYFDQKYPDLSPYLRYGGNFGTRGSKGQGPDDLMHIDLSGAPPIDAARLAQAQKDLADAQTATGASAKAAAADQKALGSTEEALQGVGAAAKKDIQDFGGGGPILAQAQRGTPATSYWDTRGNYTPVSAPSMTNEDTRSTNTSHIWDVSGFRENLVDRHGDAAVAAAEQAQKQFGLTTDQMLMKLNAGAKSIEDFGTSIGQAAQATGKANAAADQYASGAATVAYQQKNAATAADNLGQQTAAQTTATQGASTAAADAATKVGEVKTSLDATGASGTTAAAGIDATKQSADGLGESTATATQNLIAATQSVTGLSSGTSDLTAVNEEAQAKQLNLASAAGTLNTRFDEAGAKIDEFGNKIVGAGEKANQGGALAQQGSAGFAAAGNTVAAAGSVVGSTTLSLGSIAGTVQSAVRGTGGVSGLSALSGLANIGDKLLGLGGSSGSSSIFNQGGAFGGFGNLFGSGSGGIKGFVDSGLGGIFANTSSDVFAAGTGSGAGIGTNLLTGATSDVVGSGVSATGVDGLFGGLTAGGAFQGIGLGFSAGSLLNGLIGGNKTFGSLGSGFGSVAGTLAFGPIGGLIGGALGGLLGGMFGAKKPPNQSAGGSIDFSTGVVTGSFSGGNQQIDQSTKAALKELGSFTQSLLKISGGTLTGTALFQGGVNTGFTVDSSVPGYTGRFKLGKDAEEATKVVELALARTLTNISATMKTVINSVTDPAQLKDAIEFAGVYDKLKEAYDTAFSSIAQDTKLLGPFGTALDQLNATFEDLTQKAGQYGLALEPVTAGLAEATKRLKVDFQTSLSQQEAQLIGGTDFLGTALQAHQQQVMNWSDAVKLGFGDATTAARVNRVELAQLGAALGGLSLGQLTKAVSTFAESAPEVSAFAQSLIDAKQYLSDPIDQLIQAITDPITASIEKERLAGAERIRVAQATGQDQVKTAQYNQLLLNQIWDQATQSLVQLRADLTTGQASGLTAAQQVTAANDNFKRELALVQAGNLNELGNLSAAGSSAIQLSQQTWGNAPQTAALRDTIIAAIDAVLAAGIPSPTPVASTATTTATPATVTRVDETLVPPTTVVDTAVTAMTDASTTATDAAASVAGSAASVADSAASVAASAALVASGNSVAGTVDLSGSLSGSAATGMTNTPPGTILVGEEGPELISQPGGLRIWSNPDTQRILAGTNRAFADGTDVPATLLPVISAAAVSSAWDSQFNEMFNELFRAIGDNTDRVIAVLHAAPPIDLSLLSEDLGLLRASNDNLLLSSMAQEASLTAISGTLLTISQMSVVPPVTPPSDTEVTIPPSLVDQPNYDSDYPAPVTTTTPAAEPTATATTVPMVEPTATAPWKLGPGFQSSPEALTSDYRPSVAGFFATGTTMTPLGTIMVGEAGPELVSMPGRAFAEGTDLPVLPATPRAPAPAANNDELVAEVRALREQVTALLEGGNTIARAAGQVAEEGFSKVHGAVKEGTKPSFDVPVRRRA